MVLLSDLQVKEVIIIETGSRIGHIVDLEIDEQLGRITDIVLYQKKGSMFGKSEEMIIPWRNILTVGEDVILVHESGLPPTYPDQRLLE